MVDKAIDDALPLRTGKQASGFQGVKKNIGATWPEKAINAAPGLDRVEPPLTPKLFLERYMFGIPTVSPITKQKLTPDMIKDYIMRASNLFELETKVSIMPVVKRWRLPFDPAMYANFIYTEIPDKPVQQIVNLAITSASYTETNPDNANSRYPRGHEIYTIPNEWVDMANASRGTINVNPINPAFSAVGTSTSAPASGATILQFIGQQGWVPAYWNVEAVVGMGTMEGNVPVIINEAVGQMATVLLMDNLIPQYRFTSQSLNIDGLGQSVNDNLYNLLQDKRDQSQEKFRVLVNKIKGVTSNKFFTGNV